MNPNPSEIRGCYIRRDGEKFVVVDYPTWTYREYGAFTRGQNSPLDDGRPFEVAFDTKDAALAFCSDENYVVCGGPTGKKTTAGNLED